MKKFFNHRLPVPQRNFIIAEALFLLAYALLVLLIFQPFGTYEYAHPYKIAQLSGYGLLILFLYPPVKKGLLLFTTGATYDLKQEVRMLFASFCMLTVLAFFYHALVVTHYLSWRHLPMFMLYGFAFWALPFFSIVMYKKLKATGDPEKTIGNTLEIKGTNLYEHFCFNAADIVYLKSNGNYVMIYCQKDDGIKHEMIRNTLNQVSGQLIGNDFTAIHRSFLVNAKKFDRLLREDGKHLLISRKFDLRLPVSRNKVGFIEQKLKDHS
jgi:hypothetical protein